jgi:hypothetical protein
MVMCVSALALAPRPLAAQRTDSAQVAARPAARDTTGDTTRATRIRAPLTPRRAFLYSLGLPGYAQSVLGRPTSGALFVITESISIAMLRESSAGLRQARRLRTDSLLVVAYGPTGEPITQTSTYTQRLIDTRRGQVEDWFAFILANHLFAGADAYVGAHLWDLPAQVSVLPGPTGTVIAARVSW